MEYIFGWWLTSILLAIWRAHDGCCNWNFLGSCACWIQTVFIAANMQATKPPPHMPTEAYMTRPGNAEIPDDKCRVVLEIWIECWILKISRLMGIRMQICRTDRHILNAKNTLNRLAAREAGLVSYLSIAWPCRNTFIFKQSRPSWFNKEIGICNGWVDRKFYSPFRQRSYHNLECWLQIGKNCQL